ncbi:MAG: hypothetical protein AUK47_14885 [Deltaproteobacteria bacterium CG2_30_63_29]|nr:MAG: hypothetical protein AUK47_14885 [Deltaproteobacteria bacterium CG2_30_63_29]
MKARVEKNHFKPLDAFRRLGLSGNPFAQRDPWSLVPLLAPAPALVELAAQPWRALSIYGPMGSGKTTAALQVASLLGEQENTRVWRVPEGMIRWPDLDTPVLVVDEVQRLGAARVERLMTRARCERLILVGLVDGLAGTRWHERVYSPSPMTAAEAQVWAGSMIQAVAVAPNPPRLNDADAESLVRAAEGNRLRATELGYAYFEWLVTLPEAAEQTFTGFLRTLPTRP